ncbi:MAG: rRNA maturation RNase YbeY [Cyclobacteriaceae bacterium]
MSNIEFLSQEIEFEISDPSATSQWINSVVEQEGKDIDSITYIFCSDEYLLSINKDHLNHDYYTDIITFDNSFSANDIIADIFISIDRVKENAADFNVSFSQELQRVMIHGVLHLLGYKDKTDDDQKLMRQKEDTYISLRSNQSSTWNS